MYFWNKLLTYLLTYIGFCIVMVSDLICAKYCHSEQYLLNDNHSYTVHLSQNAPVCAHDSQTYPLSS